MSLALAVSQMMFRARAAERALHDSRAWTMEVGGEIVACHRTFGDDRIVFSGYLRHALPDDTMIMLRCGDDIVDVVGLESCDGEGGDGDWVELRHELVVPGVYA